ncbi:MAG: hypothetical protein A3I05_00455 [Deltaproteobacteria bacterium RIFCSPLOWO2_02_FULL_44_10]|nr:MAG: hypothetical protein A3C46_01325 [Deltaproteobacteria bacterium RIFCSPHIGHO2_02_FULL_44_16]OGQ47275.1 MAG: hypothetical protein A3I05_00455 [Deltaproteobacteria bacterium RIFCSPLOWO2_02_FULL_44_10]
MIGLLASGSINLLPDITFFWQLLCFVVVVTVLHVFVLKPILIILKQREEQTEGFTARSLSLNEGAAALEKEIETRLSVVRQEEFRRQETAQRQAEEEGRKLVQKAREKTQHEVEEHRQMLEKRVVRANEILDEEVVVFKKMILEKLTGQRT